MDEKFLDIFLSKLDPSDAIKEEIKIDDSNIYNKNLEKAVSVNTISGEPGYAFIPTVIDNEKEIINEIKKWNKNQQKILEDELKRLYNDRN